MARSREFDDATVVRAARDVFWEHGYASTSLAQLQAATGLNKSSLYQAYGSKRGLFGRALQNYLYDVIDPLLGPLESAGAGVGELVAYFSQLERLFATEAAPVATRGCLMLNTAMELGGLDSDAADRVRRYRLRIRSAFLAVARSAPGAVPDPEAEADILTSAQIGLMLTSRLDPALAASLARTLASSVRTWRGAFG